MICMHAKQIIRSYRTGEFIEVDQGKEKLPAKVRWFGWDINLQLIYFPC